MVSVHAWGATETGKKRPSNQDNFSIDDHRRIMAVADGMGGAVAGELASQMFVQTIAGLNDHQAPDSSKTAATMVQAIFRRANQAIRDHVRAQTEHEGMGCTAEVISFYSGGFMVGHVGDSRTYRFRNGTDRKSTRLNSSHYS